MFENGKHMEDGRHAVGQVDSRLVGEVEEDIQVDIVVDVDDVDTIDDADDDVDDHAPFAC